MKHYNDDDLDFEEYIQDMKKESGRDHKWMLSAVLLLGSTFVLDSLKPIGSPNRPFLSKPQHVSDISEKDFKNILKLEVDIEKYEYIYSTKELDVFKQLLEELRQYGRLEDSRTIENIAMEWMKQKSDMLANFGSSESYRTGALDVLNISNDVKFKLLIPWSATGDNPCEDCQALDGELFEPDDFPPPQHYGCQCNDPIADPVIIV